MKLVKDFTLNLFVLLVVVYLPYAFVLGDFNPMNWHWITRALYVLTLVALTTYAIKEYRKK